MPTLICGSIAYDTIMVFHDRFKNHILPDQLHILNVAFLVPDLRREFGGCAGNIAYNLKLLGEEPIVMATVGEDIQPYLERLARLGIAAGQLATIAGQFTAQAFITTDLDDNQITAFHPGAMDHSHQNHVGRALGARLAIIGPAGKLGMQQHARECAAHGIPFLFDPGQGLPMFSRQELEELVRLADYVAVNDYEGKLLEEKTGRRLEDLAGELTIHNADAKDLHGALALADEHADNNRGVRDMLLLRGVVPEAVPAAEDTKKVEQRHKRAEKLIAKTAEELPPNMTPKA